jgi:hypothetical protein
LWIVLIGARAAFSYGAAHWFTAKLVAWAVANQVTAAAIADGLIFMAVVMVLVRTIGLGVRASRLPAPAPAAQQASAGRQRARRPGGCGPPGRARARCSRPEPVVAG